LSYINVSQFSECMESLTNSHPTGECEHQCWSSINAHAAHTQKCDTFTLQMHASI